MSVRLNSKNIHMYVWYVYMYGMYVCVNLLQFSQLLPVNLEWGLEECFFSLDFFFRAGIKYPYFMAHELCFIYFDFS